MISHIFIENFWNKYDFAFSPYEDVNIFLGENGSGKTTLLNHIKNAFGLSQSFELKKGNSALYTEKTVLTKVNSEFEFISTFDVVVNNKAHLSKDKSPLDLSLQNLIKGVGRDTSILQYLLKERNNKELPSSEILFEVVNDFFKRTNKKILFDYTFDLKFQIHEEHELLPLNKLSSGEKQLLILLFTVFLHEGKPLVLLLDEPEISLHATWQRRLIASIRNLNPKCQLFITTHSGSIVAEGWGSKVWRMENLLKQGEQGTMPLSIKILPCKRKKN